LNRSLNIYWGALLTGTVVASLVRESTTEAIYTLDEGGNITSWNRGAQQAFGYPADAVLGYELLCRETSCSGAGAPACQWVLTVADPRHREELPAKPYSP